MLDFKVIAKQQFTLFKVYLTFDLDVTNVPCHCGSLRLSYFNLTVRFVTGVGLVLGAFGLVLAVYASFYGGPWMILGFRGCCVWLALAIGRGRDS